MEEKWVFHLFLVENKMAPLLCFGFGAVKEQREYKYFNPLFRQRILDYIYFAKRVNMNLEDWSRLKAC